MLPPCLHKTDRVDISAVFDKMTATTLIMYLMPCAPFSETLLNSNRQRQLINDNDNCKMQHR